MRPALWTRTSLASERPAGEGDNHARIRAGRTDDLDPLHGVAGPVDRLGRRNRDHLDAVEARLELGADHVAHPATGGEKIARQGASRLAGTGGPPGPRAIWGLAGQLNVCITRHSIAHATAAPGTRMKDPALTSGDETG
jgi:hypothetical protein